MKRILIVLMVLLGFCSFAGAQKFSIGGGITGSAGSGQSAQIGASLQFTVGDLVKIGPIGVDLRVNADATFSSSTSIEIGVSPLATFQVAQFRLYAGPSLKFFIPGGLGFGAAAGFNYPIAPGLNSYAELNLTFAPFSSWAVRVGVQYSF
jgi:hypothetical protein